MAKGVEVGEKQCMEKKEEIRAKVRQWSATFVNGTPVGACRRPVFMSLNKLSIKVIYF